MSGSNQTEPAKALAVADVQKMINEAVGGLAVIDGAEDGLTDLHAVVHRRHMAMSLAVQAHQGFAPSPQKLKNDAAQILDWIEAPLRDDDETPEKSGK